MPPLLILSIRPADQDPMGWRKSAAAGKIGNKKEGKASKQASTKGICLAEMRRLVGVRAGEACAAWMGGAVEVTGESGASGQPEGGTERAPGVGGSTAPQA